MGCRGDQGQFEFIDTFSKVHIVKNCMKTLKKPLFSTF